MVSHCDTNRRMFVEYHAGMKIFMVRKRLDFIGRIMVLSGTNI